MHTTQYQKSFNLPAKSLGRIAVLYGGISAEREISLKSGQAILDALQKANFDAFGLDVKKGEIEKLLNLQCDRVFIAMHGVGGEDGRIQALLDWLNIPYTGSGVAASALALDKLKTKLVWQGLGLPTPQFIRLAGEPNFDNVLAELGGECFIKPANEGSSLGMRCVNSPQDLADAFTYAKQFDAEVLAERRVLGREFTVAILNGTVLPAIELKVENKFYDFDAKYVSNATQYLCPCDLSVEKMHELQQLALSAFSAIGCKTWGRVDLMQDNDEKFYLLEVNTVPGMTDHSLVPMAAKVAGLSFSELVQEILVSTV